MRAAVLVPLFHDNGSVTILLCVSGDNILTALSVGRQCGMVGRKDRVILLNAHAPEGDEPAKISWELADTEISIDHSSTDFEGVSRY